MTLMKYTAKYLLRSLGVFVILVIIFGIGGFIHNQRNSTETQTITPPENNSELIIPKLSQKRSTSGGHYHADGTFHADASQHVSENNNEDVSKYPTKTIRRAPRQKTANQSSFGWITWKYGRTTIRSLSPYIPDWTPLPEEIKDDVHLLRMEQFARESLNNRVKDSKQDGIEIDLLEIINHPVIGYVDSIPNAMSVLLDKKGNPLPPFSESEYAEEELRRLVGDRDLEESAQFLEQHGHYNELLLSRLSDERAFDYLYTIAAPNSSGVPDGSLRMYAERVVASDPTHLKARLYLADTSSSAESMLDQYESILVDHPDSAHALIEAARLLSHLDRPFKAIAYFEKGHELGARQGHFGASLAFQKLGDYKTAWVYLNKAIRVSEGHLQFRIKKYMDAIEAGVPMISPLPVEKLDIPDKAFLDRSFPSDTDFAWDVPASERNVPRLLDSDLSDEASEYQRAKVQARAEAESARRQEIEMMRQMSQQEIDEFIQWAEQVMREEDSQEQTTNFLGREMAAHLTGKAAQFTPKRIVRANELIKRYGYEEGLSRISKDDPEIAIQIQLLRNQNNPQPLKKESKR